MHPARPSASELTLGTLAFCVGAAVGYSALSGYEDEIATQEAATRAARPVTASVLAPAKSSASVQAPATTAPPEAVKQYFGVRDRARSLKSELERVRRDQKRHQATYPADRARASFDEAYWRADQEKLDTRVRELELDMAQQDAELERYRCDSGSYGGQCWH